jgi:hypothetical protein
MKILALIGFVSSLFAINSFAATESSIYKGRPNSASNGGDFGLGLMLGEPTGLTGKYWLSETSAIDAGFAYSFGNYTTVLADYLWHFPGAFASAGPSGNEFVPFVGIGGVLFISGNSWNGTYRDSNAPFFVGSSGNSAAFGARIPLGIEFLPKAAPIGIFAEIDPGIGLLPSTFGFFGGEVGARFYF